MKKFLSIIIPRYKETEHDMFPLLSSISNQVGIDKSDLEIIIASDGGNPGPLDEDFLSLFDIETRQVSLQENKGPGVARQAGLDIAKGQYVTFCDADDIIHNVGVFGALMQEVDRNAPDLLTSSWLEELRTPDGTMTYLTHQQENTWMFGKLLRRQFLVQNNIRFHNDLRVHEDSYLLAIAADTADKLFHLPVVTYVWKFKEDSITRKDNGIYSFSEMPTFVKACTMAHKEIERIKPERMEWKTVQFVLYNYFTYHMPHWLDPSKDEYRKKSEETFVECIRPTWHYWKDTPRDRLIEMYNQERDRTFKGAIETETLDAWIERLGLSD